MKKILIALFVLLSEISFGQNIIDTSSVFIKDSCWNEKHIDTIPIYFVITVDSNNFVKKERADFIVDKYEMKRCKVADGFGFYAELKLNEMFLLNGKNVEVLLYRKKEEPYSLTIGNSQ